MIPIQLIGFLLLCFLIYPSTQLGETMNSTLAKYSNLYTTQCTSDSDCTPNSYCYVKKCVCKSQYIPYRDTSGIVKCLKEAVDIDDYCEEDVQCEATLGNHAVCRKDDPKIIVGKCSCANDSHYIDNLCYKSSFIGHTCQVDDNCLIRNRNIKAYCTYGQCTCPPHYHAIDHGKDCVKSSELNGPCNSSDSCITLNSECKDGSCKCKLDFISDTGNKLCLYLSEKIGDPCDEDKQCSVKVPHSKCDSSKAICLCLDGYHEKEGKCWHTANLLGRCDNINECKRDDHHGRGVICKDNICQCKYGYYIEENKFCKKMANYTEDDSNCGLTGNISSYLLIGTLIITLQTHILKMTG